MSNISTKDVAELREAAAAWRQHAARAISPIWPRPVPAPNMSVHDRIDEMIDEIERLRSTASCKPAGEASIAPPQGAESPASPPSASILEISE